MKNNNEKLFVRVFFLTLILLTIYTVFKYNFLSEGILDKVSSYLEILSAMFLNPKLSMITYPELIVQILITLQLALLTTLISVFISFILAVLATPYITNEKTSLIIRSIASVIRAIPTIIWVLVFSIAIGLGAEAAVLGMCFHSISYLVKTYSDEFEALDYSIVESFKATGASRIHLIFSGMIPMTFKKLFSWTFLRFEINFGVSVVMGAIAGAGGIGYQLYLSSAFYYDFNEVGAITYALVILAIGIESLSRFIRKKVS